MAEARAVSGWPAPPSNRAASPPRRSESGGRSAASVARISIRPDAGTGMSASCAATPQAVMSVAIRAVSAWTASPARSSIETSASPSHREQATIAAMIACIPVRVAA